ncbi:MAG: IS3 family transposase [Gammaproteobacteria bacterium]
MRLLDEPYTENPTDGVERMTARLQRSGHEVGPKRVRRLFCKIGLEVLYQTPDTSHRTLNIPCFRACSAGRHTAITSRPPTSLISGWRKDSFRSWC